MRKFSRDQFNKWAIPQGLMVLCFLSFGLLIPQLGFYFDDWAKTLVGRFWGLEGYWDYYAGDRPLSAWTHIAFIPILGYKPVVWHVFTLSLRWLTALGIFWTLRSLWPGRRLQAFLTAALFSVHPFFTQQSIPLTYFQQWLQYVLFIFALGAMVQSVRQPRRFLMWTVLSLSASLVQLTITEYFAVLELLRPLLLLYLCYVPGKSLRQRFFRSLRLWIPYLVLILIFLLWRLVFMRFPGNEDPYRPALLYSLLSDPAAMIKLIRIAGMDSLYILVTQWSRVVGMGLSEMIQPFILFSWAIALSAALLLTIFLLFVVVPQNEDQNQSDHWLQHALTLGFLAFFFGCAPAWLSDRVVIEGYRSDRYALPALFGASLITASLIDWFINSRKQKAIFFSVLVGLCIAFNLQVSNQYRWQNVFQTRFFWQLYWRAPYIEPGTAIIMEKDVFPELGIFSLSSAVNLVYPPPQGKERLPYWVYTLLPKYANLTPDPFNTAFFTRFRSFVFEGTTPQTLLIHYEPEKANCWWMLSQQDEVNPHLSPLVKTMLSAAHLERIIPEAISGDYPPADLFGKEPEHTWCYYYQKADLARQSRDWQTAANLGDEVVALGIFPDSNGANSPHEWMPFIEAYAHTGKWEQARSLTLTGYKTDPEYGNALCSLWSRINNETEESQKKAENQEEVLTALGCTR